MQYSLGLQRLFPKPRKAEEAKALAWCRSSCRGLAKLQVSDCGVVKKIVNVSLLF